MQVISKLVLGTVQLGLKYGINNSSEKPSPDEAVKMLAAAHRSGIKILDSAEVYGESHNIIGEYHKKNPCSTFQVISKLPAVMDGPIESKLDEYLDQLGVKELEALLFHSFDTYNRSSSELKTLDVLRKRGKVNFIGVSVYTNSQLEQAIDDRLIDIVQVPFNLFDNTSQRGSLLEKARQKGKIVHTRSTFLQGLFFCPTDSTNVIVKALGKQLSQIRELSIESGISVAKLALNYCLQQPFIDKVLIGVDNLPQLNQNIADAEGNLSELIIRFIDTIRIENTDLLNPSLWNSLKL